MVRLGSDEATAEDTNAVCDMAVTMMRSNVGRFGCTRVTRVVHDCADKTKLKLLFAAMFCKS